VVEGDGLKMQQIRESVEGGDCGDLTQNCSIFCFPLVVPFSDEARVGEGCPVSVAALLATGKGHAEDIFVEVDVCFDLHHFLRVSPLEGAAFASALVGYFHFSPFAKAVGGGADCLDSV